MFTLKPTHIALAALLSATATQAFAQDKEAEFGTPATAEEIAAIDIDIMPDGTGLPEGSGSYAEGQEVYEWACSACHGEDMMGVKDLGAPALIGGRGTLATDAPVKTIESYWPHASTAFDYIRRAMPMNAPGSLSDDEVYAVTAYILGKANIISEETTLDAESFELIEMPNQDGFVEDPRPGSY